MSVPMEFPQDPSGLWQPRPQPTDDAATWDRWAKTQASIAERSTVELKRYEMAWLGAGNGQPNDLCIITSLVAAQLSGGKAADVAAAVALMKAIKAATAPKPTPLPPP